MFPGTKCQPETKYSLTMPKEMSSAPRYNCWPVHTASWTGCAGNPRPQSDLPLERQQFQ